MIPFAVAEDHWFGGIQHYAEVVQPWTVAEMIGLNGNNPVCI